MEVSVIELQTKVREDITIRAFRIYANQTACPLFPLHLLTVFSIQPGRASVNTQDFEIVKPSRTFVCSSSYSEQSAHYCPP